MPSTLSVFDRCDVCGFQAFVRATRDGHVLLFCGHHGTQHRAALQAHGWCVTDELDQIDPRSQVPARV